MGVGCLVPGPGGGKKPPPPPPPNPPPPLPTAGLAGQRVALTPLALVAAEDTLHLDALVAAPRNTLDNCDIIIGPLLPPRAPELTWVGPAELRHTAPPAIPIPADSDPRALTVLRPRTVTRVPH